MARKSYEGGLFSIKSDLEEEKISAPVDQYFTILNPICIRRKGTQLFSLVST
jgi:hypothetical protein